MTKEQKLLSVKRKTITKKELADLARVDTDAELFRWISEAEAENLLSPIKNSGTDGNRIHPIYMKYRIIKPEAGPAAAREIALLHPMLLENGYLRKKPDAYQTYRDAIQKLNAYLFKGLPSVPVSKKERSFEIFREEKQLEDRPLRNLLDRLGMTAEVLRYYETPEYDFDRYIAPEQKDCLTLLICENKDIWFNIRRRMAEDGAREIFGERIDGVVYGSGNKISQVRALEVSTGYLGVKEVSYLYWGDIDRAGLNIYLSVKKGNPGLRIQPFVPAYLEMLKLIRGRPVPDSDDNRGQIGEYLGLSQHFPTEAWAEIAALIQANKRVPQEVITYEHLLTYMR